MSVMANVAKPMGVVSDGQVALAMGERSVQVS